MKNIRWGLYVVSTIVSVLLLAYLIHFYFFQNNGTNSDEIVDGEDVIAFIYDIRYLGYNSTDNYGSFLIPGPSELYPPLDIDNLSLSIYSYDAIDIANPVVFTSVLDTYFPEISIQNNIEIDAHNKVVVSNASYQLELLRSGGIHYQSKKAPSLLDDNITTVEKANTLALDFLKHHGGVPVDIDEIDSSAWPLLEPDGSTIIGKYHVIITRELENYPVKGGFLFHQIQFIFDAGTQEILEFSYHWPKIDEYLVIEELTPIEDVLDYYHMNDTSSRKDNITNYVILFYTPYSMHQNAYDTVYDTVFLAPCWYIITESGNSYYLGMVIPRE